MRRAIREAARALAIATKCKGRFYSATDQRRSSRDRVGRPEIVRRVNRGFAAGMGHRHARSAASAFPSHVAAALLLIRRKLCGRSGTRHDRPSQQEDNQQQSKIEKTFHKRSLRVRYSGTGTVFQFIRYRSPAKVTCKTEFFGCSLDGGF